MDRVRCGSVWCLMAVLAGCGGRTELEADGPTETDPTKIEVPPHVDPPPLTLPPPEPTCANVQMPSCQPMPEPFVFEDVAVAVDIAWQGSAFIVVYTRDDDALIGAAVTPDGDVLWHERIGEGGGPRIAWHPHLQRGVVVSERGYRMLRADTQTTGPFQEHRPFDALMIADAMATPDGVRIIAGHPEGADAHPGAVLEVSADATWQALDNWTIDGWVGHNTSRDNIADFVGARARQQSSRLFHAVWDIADATLQAAVVAGPVVNRTPDTFVRIDHEFYFIDADTEAVHGTVAGIHMNVLGYPHGLLPVFGGIHQHTSAVHALAMGTTLAMATTLFDSDPAQPMGLWGLETPFPLGPIAPITHGPLAAGPDGDEPRMTHTACGVAIAWIDEDGRVLVNDLRCDVR